MTKRKVVYIGGSLTIAGIIIALLAINGVTVQTSGDIQCGHTCVSYINITSKAYNICFNMTGLIETMPNVTTELYIKNGKKWVLFNLSKDCVNGTSKHQFQVIGHKTNMLQKVKWYAPEIGVSDPLWDSASISINNTVCQSVTYQNQTITKYVNVTDANGTYSVPIYSNSNYKSVVCTSKIPILVADGKEISLPMGVSQANNITVLDDTLDGNGDGICQPGESCCWITNGRVSCNEDNAALMRITLSKAGIQ